MAVGLVGWLFLKGGDHTFAAFDDGFLHCDGPCDTVQFVVETCSDMLECHQRALEY